MAVKIVALSTCDCLGSYLIRRVHAVTPIDKLVRLRVQPPPTSWQRRIKNLLTGRILWTLEQRMFYSRMYATSFAAIERQLRLSLPSNELLSAELPPSVDVVSARVNSPETVSLLRELAPDLLLVCSAPLLKPEIFSIPRIATLNMHFGWSPEYRGEHTMFWPLYFRDYQKLGVTIHRIDNGIDTGPLLAQGRVEISPHDTEATLLAKAAQLGADMLGEVLTRAAIGPIPGVMQTARGRNFSYRGRRVWHDALLFVRRKFLRERLPFLPEERWLMTAGNERSASPTSMPAADAVDPAKSARV